MPKINTYKCSDCDYEFPMGWGGYTYVTDNNCNRVACPHPAEVSQIADTLNIENKIVYSVFGESRPRWWWSKKRRFVHDRIGFNSFAVCLDCVSPLILDIHRDKRQCRKCPSHNVRTVLELVNQPCPQCKVGTIKEVWTGVEC